jgi:hypothetical protein
VDGLKKGPIAHGACTDEDWMGKAIPVVQARINRRGPAYHTTPAALSMT